MAVPYRPQAELGTPLQEISESKINDPEDIDQQALEEEYRAAARGQLSYADAKRLKRRADVRILPLIMLGYLVKNMDQGLPSYIAAMNSGTPRNPLIEMGISKDTWSFVQTAFYATFIVFEIPSNMLITRTSPRLHLVRIMSAWSLVAMCHAACQNAAGFLACRALLGFATAGFFPGSLYLLSCWYRPDEITVRMACLSVLAQFAFIADTILVYAFSHTTHGLSGWRWCYIVMGIVGIILSIAYFFYMPDYPDSTPSRRHIYTQEEGDFMAARLPPNAAGKRHHVTWRSVKNAAKSPLLYAYALWLLFLNSSTHGLSFWLPTIIKDFGLVGPTTSMLLNIPPAALTITCSLLLAWFYDNDTRIPRHLAAIVCIVLFALALMAITLIHSTKARYAMILIAYIPYAGTYLSLNPLRLQTATSEDAAFVLAFTNAVGQLHGLFAAQIFRARFAPQYTVPFIVCIVFALLAAVSVGVAWFHSGGVEKETREVARKRRDEGRERNVVVQEDVGAAVVSFKARP